MGRAQSLASLRDHSERHLTGPTCVGPGILIEPRCVSRSKAQRTRTTAQGRGRSGREPREWGVGSRRAACGTQAPRSCQETFRLTCGSVLSRSQGSPRALKSARGRTFFKSAQRPGEPKPGELPTPTNCRSPGSLRRAAKASGDPAHPGRTVWVLETPLGSPS